MADQQITCSDCGDAFVFTQAEQSFYAEKGLTTAPKRCKACRAARKTSQGDRGGERGGDRGGNRFSPSNGRSGGGGEGGWRPRVQAGAPRGGSAPQNGGGSAGGWDRPRAGGPSRGPTGPGTPVGGNRWNAGAAPRMDAPRPRVEDVQSRAPRDRDGFQPRREQAARPARAAEPTHEKAAPRERAPKPKFDITCAECGTTAQVPFKPLEGRQVFCQPCYRARKGTTETAVEGLAVTEADSGIVE